MERRWATNDTKLMLNWKYCRMVDDSFARFTVNPFFLKPVTLLAVTEHIVKWQKTVEPIRTHYNLTFCPRWTKFWATHKSIKGVVQHSFMHSDFFLMLNMLASNAFNLSNNELEVWHSNSVLYTLPQSSYRFLKVFPLRKKVSLHCTIIKTIKAKKQTVHSSGLLNMLKSVYVKLLF